MIIRNHPITPRRGNELSAQDIALAQMLRFLKEWTLPVSMAAGTMLYLIFAFVPQLGTAALFFAPLMDALLPCFMFLVLFVTFCKVDFDKIRPVWWHLWVMAFYMVLVTVIMAIIITIDCSPSQKILLESLLLCVIAPCATASAVVTQKLCGSLEQMTTLTFISNFVTALLVPLCFPLIEKGAESTSLAAFGKMLYQVMVLLVLPMLLAYVVKHGLHRIHRRIVAVRDLSFYLWCCSLMIITGTTVKNIVHANASALLLLSIAILGLVICVIQFAVGRYIGHFFGHAQEAGQALGQKNTTFAIWLSYTYLNPLSSVGPGCYILWQNIINSIEIWDKRRQSEAE